MCNVLFLKLCAASLVLWVGMTKGETPGRPVVQSVAIDSIGHVKELKGPKSVPTGQVKELKGSKSVVRSRSVETTGKVDELKGPKSVVRSRSRSAVRSDYTQAQGSFGNTPQQKPPISDKFVVPLVQQATPPNTVDWNRTLNLLKAMNEVLEPKGILVMLMWGSALCFFELGSRWQFCYTVPFIDFWDIF